MNPHFVSNSLNSINYYILENKKEEASKYLVKFARLIRGILQNSNAAFVPLEKELDSIKLYLDMEALRFKNAFDYDLKISDEVALDMPIPAMIIQPFIENAIWHGIRPAQIKGNLTIHINKTALGIEVIIKDNGIGISNSRQSKSMKEGQRKSYGTDMIEKRLRLLNELHNKHYSILISDNIGSDGTSVILNL